MLAPRALRRVLPLLLLGASGCVRAATTKLRIAYRPNTTALSPIDEDWAISYSYTVPPDKPAAEWDPSEGVFFIWGDTDFDSYGPRSPPTQMHDYVFNQIVPQLVIGDTLAAGNASTNYNPGWITFKDWNIQAQYFWAKQLGGGEGGEGGEGGPLTAAELRARPAGTSVATDPSKQCDPKSRKVCALCGDVVPVKANDVITTKISYDSGAGSMHASIESSGGGGASTIDIPRPFPNDATLYKDWADFFKQAQEKSEESEGPGVLHHPDWNVEAGVEDGNTLCSVCSDPGFSINAAGVDKTSHAMSWSLSYPQWQGQPVNCTDKCITHLPSTATAAAAAAAAASRAALIGSGDSANGDEGKSKCGGEITNGTRPGADYASVKMNPKNASAVACQHICCADHKCKTWVYVSAEATKSYPKRPQGAYCWLKAKPIALKGTACDNGHPGCISGIVNRTAGA